MLDNAQCCCLYKTTRLVLVVWADDSRLAVRVALLDERVGHVVEVVHGAVLSRQRVLEVFVSLQQRLHRLDRVLRMRTNITILSVSEVAR